MAATAWRLGGSWQRIVCVGDIHGDLDALLRILRHASMMDDCGDWIGGTSLVLLIGDLNDRGPDSASVVSFVMALQRQAESSGGEVECLLGNHEMLAAQGDYRYVSATEVLALEGFWLGDTNGLHAFYRGEGPYAQWLRQRPAIIAAGQCLFVHAGIGTWIRDTDPGWINSTLSSWVAHFQGVAPEPDEASYWLTDGEASGPLWTHHFVCDPAVQKPDAALARCIGETLEAFGVRRLVVGHKPTERIGFEVGYPHPVYGETVVAIDTGISKFYGGRLSVVECVDGDIIAKYCERGSGELALTSEVRRRSARERERFTEEAAAGA